MLQLMPRGESVPQTHVDRRQGFLRIHSPPGEVCGRSHAVGHRLVVVDDQILDTAGRPAEPETVTLVGTAARWHDELDRQGLLAIRGAIEEIVRYAVQHRRSPSGQDRTCGCCNQGGVNTGQTAVIELVRLPQTHQTVNPGEKVDQAAGHAAGP